MTNKIKLGVDSRMVRHSGIGTYIRHMLDTLVEDPDFDMTLYGPLDKISEYPCQKIHAPYPIYSLKEQFYFPRALQRITMDCYYFPHYNIPLSFKGNIVVTIHDLIHLVYPPSKMAYFYAKTMIKATCQKAKQIVVTSNYTKEDLNRRLAIPKEKITVIHTGAGIDFSAVGGKRGQSLKGQSPFSSAEIPYLLYVGNVKPSKNVQTLIEATLIAKKKIPEIRLLIAGKNSMPELAEKYKGNSEILFLGESSVAKLHQLYSQAKLFIFPSLYEGFGLPPLEAMSLGVPVIASNATSLPEVCGNAAEFFDPRNKDVLAEKIVALWNNTSKREDLIQRGYENIKRFSWEKCAREMANVFREACDIKSLDSGFRRNDA